MNEKQNLMLKALNVNHKKVIYILIIFFITSCAISRKDIVDNNYNLKKFKSKSGITKVIINAYDDSGGLIPANTTVNNVFFQIKSKNNKFIPLEIITNPNSQVNIEVSSIIRHTVKINSFRIKKSDSIIINTYLKKDNSPLH